MKLAFVHDHKFRYINGDFYSLGGLSNEVLTRYTNFFGEVTILSRVLKEENSNNKYSKISNDKVTIKNTLNMSRRAFKNEILSSDYVISRLPSFNGIKAVYYANKYNKPCLIELVGCPWDSLWNHSLKGKAIAPFVTLITKKMVLKAEFVLYVTNEFLQSRYPTNGHSVSCSNVALAQSNESILEYRLNRINHLNSNEKLIIGTAAAVNVAYKGQQYVIKAIADLKKEGYHNFEYQLVGSGDQSFLKGIAQKYGVEDQVIFIGSISHNEVFKWLDSIDLYVQPSRQEGLPRALIEAMSRGLPSFGAKTAGIPELIEDKYLFSNTSKNIMEICKILMKYNKNEMLVQAATNFYSAKDYDREKIEQKRQAFFEMFVKNNLNELERSKL